MFAIGKEYCDSEIMRAETMGMQCQFSKQFKMLDASM